MINNQDNWEKITNLTNEYEPELDLANDVILKLNQRESTVKFKKASSVWVIVAICFVLVVAIFIGVFINKNNNKLYLKDNDLSIVKVEDVNKFVAENKLDIFYNNSPNCNTQSVFIDSDQRLAYIEQSYYFMSEDGFEFVNLKIVFIDAVYNFSENFTLLSKATQVADIDINYDTILSDSGNNVYAKFSINKVGYYLEINDVANIEITLSGIILSLIN